MKEQIEIEPKEEKGLKELLEEIRKNQEDMLEPKKPKFDIPWYIRWFSRGKLKKGYAIVQYLRCNGAVEYKIEKIEDNCIKVGDNFHDARAGHIMKYKNMPFLIIPEWNTVPLSPFKPQEDFDDAEGKGLLTSTHKLLLTKMKMEAVKPKTDFNWKWILIIGGALIGVYFLLGYLKII